MTPNSMGIGRGSEAPITLAGLLTRTQVKIMSQTTGTAGQAPYTEATAFKPVSLALGLIIGLGVFFLLPESLALDARIVAGIAMLMATWWMTEAIPIPATSLLPLVLFPFFDIASVGATASPYAHRDRKSTRLNSSHVRISY